MECRRLGRGGGGRGGVHSQNLFNNSVKDKNPTTISGQFYHGAPQRWSLSPDWTWNQKSAKIRKHLTILDNTIENVKYIQQVTIFFWNNYAKS